MKKQEIAKLAGVSPSAVSLVLNGKAGVSDETRSKILSIAKEHNVSYTIPKEQDKTIAFLKYSSHGIIVEENNGFILSIIEQLEKECRKNLYNFQLHSFSRESLNATVEYFTDSAPTGIVILGSEMEYGEINKLLSIPCPKLILDSKMDTALASSVLMANEDIVSAAFRHLYELGHRRIGFISSSIYSSNFDLRYNAYLNALREHRLDYDEEYVMTATPTLGGSYEDLLFALKKNRRRPTAFISANDILAIGAVRALQEAGYRVPDDISVVGIDDVPYSAITSPPLTTMKISRISLGSMAFDLLSHHIFDLGFPNTCIQLSGELIIRSSTAPPANREQR